MMPRPLWLMIGWSLVIPIASPLLLALVLVLVPGRKGRMRTQRQTVFPAMRLEEAQPYFTQRLRHDDFVVEPSADPSRVMGIRRRPPEAQPGLDPTMIIELTFVSQADGLQVSAVAWFGELTFFDSGEGRLIDQTLERMLHGDLDREPRPLLRTFDYMAVSALVAAVLCLAAMGYLYLHSPPATIARAAMVAGLVLSCFATLFIARDARRQILHRPAELTGRGAVAATFVLGSIGIVVGIAILVLQYRESMVAFWRDQAGA
jgi:hypothetical protein